MIPCSGFIEEVQNVRTSTMCVLFSPKLVHVLPPSVELCTIYICVCVCLCDLRYVLQATL